MTIEELREEADALGYKLVKKTERIHMLPCTCGCNRREHWYTYVKGKEVVQLVCNKCGRSVYGVNEQDAKRNWNKMIEGKMK